MLFRVLLVLPLGAQTIKPFVMPSARAAGFGGIHAAQGDDFSSIFSNPASFAGLEKEWSAAEITISLYGPMFQILDNIVNSSGDISSIANTDRFAAGFDIGGPLAIGIVNKGFAFGIFNRTTADTDIRFDLLGRQLLPTVSEEVFLTGGYSFHVLERDNHTVDIGFLGKGFYRARISMQAPASDLGSMFDTTSSAPFETHFGLGIDIGLSYTYAGIVTVALAGYDVFSPALVTEYADSSDWGTGGSQSYARVQPRLALGALWRIRNDFLDRYISGLTFMADYRDFINLFEKDRRHPLLNVSLGMEVTLLKILRFRAGMADALPAAGFGINMTVLTLDVAFHGKELGNKPGDKRTFAFDLGILFRY